VWGCQVEVLEVNGAKASTLSRQDTVEQQLDKFQKCSIGTHVPWVADAIAPNCDASTIRIAFVGMQFAYNHGVTECFLLVGWDVLVLNAKEGVDSLNPLGALGRT
jgi:hypothetical protein